MSGNAAGRSGKSAVAGQPRCADGLLWIGQTYPQFFCGRPESCLNPERPQGPHCFVHEAELRGISRRIPRVPPWAVPGRTRIFLTHRGGERDAWRGRIFGYFVLDRIEVMATPHSLPHYGDGERPEPSLKPGPVERKPRRKGKPDEDDDDEKEPKTRTKECWDGELIVTHWYEPEAKKWIPTGAKCSHPPEPPEDEDGGEDGGVRYLPVDDEELAPHRGCSRRKDPGAVYLVDSLEAAIADAFADRLDRGSIRKERDQETAEELFNTLVNRIVTRRAPRTRVPGALRGKAHAHGELVLFDDPPLFEQRPQAQFRGLAHIDGDHLLNQVAKGVAKPDIRSCRKRKGVTTHQEVVAVIAERAHANKTFADQVLTELSDLAHEELDRYGEFRIPGMGTLARSDGGQVRFHPLGKKPG